ncbi:MAG: ADP-ribosylglycohydrolase family protein [Leptolyngbyaceae cyanobacterium]
MDKARFQGCLMGLAAGDAVGTTVEFCPRGSFTPVTDMVGGGPFNLKPGDWTDDTSMALCLATSLIEQGGFDPSDQIERYCRWQETGYLSSTDECFDIGNTVTQALARYRLTQDPFSGSTAPRSAGNGCIMRLAPVPMFFAADPAMAIHQSGQSARTTHGAYECVAASRLFGAMLVAALQGESKANVLLGHAALSDLPDSIRAIAVGQYRQKPDSDIRGNGYVVDSLEAALWSFWTTDNLEAAILKAVNLGDDADTTGAICGQLAGAFYGIEAIPPAWRQRLTLGERIETLANQLYKAALTESQGL